MDEKAPVLVAKMYCRQTASISQPGDKQQESVELNCVYGQGDTSNAKWSKWTPYGELKLAISNPEAFGKIKPGESYLVQLVPCGQND